MTTLIIHRTRDKQYQALLYDERGTYIAQTETYRRKASVPRSVKGCTIDAQYGGWCRLTKKGRIVFTTPVVGSALEAEKLGRYIMSAEINVIDLVV